MTIPAVLRAKYDALVRLRGWRADVTLLLTGALAALALPPVHVVVVLALCFPVLMRMIDAAPDWRGAARCGFMFGLGFHTAGLYWLTDAIMLRMDSFWWLVPLASPGCALILTPTTAVPAALARIVPAGMARCLVLASAWTIADMMRVFIFSGFPWNPPGSVWEFPGHAGDVMIQPAAWIGVDGLTLLTVLLALAPLWGRRGWIFMSATLALWVTAGITRLSLRSDSAVSGHNPVVVLVQGNVPEAEKMAGNEDVAIFRRYLGLTRQGVEQALHQGTQGRPIVFAWPESAFPGLLLEDAIARRMIMQAGQGAAAGVIGTLRQDDQDRWRNSMVMLVPPDGRVADIYDKSHLVPFGEYQPALLPFHVVPGDGMAAGGGVRTWHVPGVSPFGPLICYEVIFSGQTVDPHDRPSWLLNSTNDGWYGNSAGPRQHLAAVRMRAVEEGLPVARAANTGISAIFDGYGHETAWLGWDRTGTIVQPMPEALSPPFFARWGRLVPLLLALLTLASALVAGLRGRGVTRRS
ncbi:apolipoprotein N-acyltransferase [Novacetimonas pomaceti]|uniref:apolipoprotein N-acyltransferase n=1 Tax=Novacetimonas pomaceti TaxID=2021998 RepID=UPI001C2D7DE1|nr:apolipoprotein N-acyltransferase [Novacetimonas pomaceti]MBV1833378.1 apolipoprotein N-acyltransferase [Novacetimonas pomaceti]